jgi:hypothetical protein
MQTASDILDGDFHCYTAQPPVSFLQLRSKLYNDFSGFRISSGIRISRSGVTECLFCLRGLSLAGFGVACWLNPRHHLFLCDEVIDPLQQSQKTLHISAPFIEDIVRVSRLGEANDSGGTVNLCVDGLGRDQFADILLRLVLGEIQELGQALHLDTGVVFGHDTDVVLDDALSQVLPPLVCLVIAGLASLSVEDVSAAEMRTELL